MTAPDDDPRAPDPARARKIEELQSELESLQRGRAHWTNDASRDDVALRARDRLTGGGAPYVLFALFAGCLVLAILTRTPVLLAAVGGAALVGMIYGLAFIWEARLASQSQREGRQERVKEFDELIADFRKELFRLGGRERDPRAGGQRR